MINNLCNEHKREPTKGRCSTCSCIRAERQVAKFCVNRLLLEFDFTISVNDGEEWVVKQSTDMKVIIDAMFSTDEDMLKVRRKGGELMGFVCFTYGNSGYEVISDYSTRLEPYMSEINRYMESREH